MKKSKNQLFKFFFYLHIYAGLFSAFYLVIVGVSAMNFQHKFFSEEPRDTIITIRQVKFNPSLKQDSLASFIAGQLNIKGHIPPWNFQSDNSGNLRFKIERPARTFEISLNRNHPDIHIAEIHYSFGRILRALHFGIIGELDIPMLKAWSSFTLLSTILAFLSLCTSLVFWYKKSVKTRSQTGIVIFSGLSSIFLILYIWLVG